MKKLFIVLAVTSVAIAAHAAYQPIVATLATVYNQTSPITAPAGTVITVTIGKDIFATFTVPANQNFSGTLTLKGSAQ